MHTVSVKEARENISELLTEVLQGEDVVITRRGKRIVRMIPDQEVQAGKKGFPSLAALRAKQKVKGLPISQEVVAMRDEERS